MEYVLIVGKCIVGVRILKNEICEYENQIKPYELHKIDENGDLRIYWNGEYYKVADKNNPLKIFKGFKKCHT